MIKNTLKILVISAVFFALTIVNAAAENEFWVRARHADNPSLYQSLDAFYADGGYEFMLPHNADASKLTVTVFDNTGTQINKFTHDFTQSNTLNVPAGSKSFKLTVNVSTLPAIFLEIDESHGTIADMNASPDHSASCYGDITINTPENLAQMYSCETIVTSKGNDEKEKTPGTFRLRGRGNTTWKTDTDKQRPYGIKLEKGLNILGMGKNKDWALLRFNSFDNVLSNKITYDMANDFKITYTPEARMADVYLNDHYIGMYTVTETVKIGSSRVDIADIDEQLENGLTADKMDLTGGYLLEIDNNPEILQFSTNSCNITIKSPEELDKSLAGGKYSYITNLMSNLFNAIYGNGYLPDGRHFSEVLDLESCAKYFLLQEMTGNYDAGRGSTYLYKDSDKNDPKVYMGPVWDGDVNFRFFPDQWIVYHRTISYDNVGKYNVLSALCEHKEFTDYLNYYYYDESNPNNLRRIFKQYEQNLWNYEVLVSKSALATTKLYLMETPVYWHYLSYVKDRLNFLDNNLSSLINSASKGTNVSIIRNGNLNAYVREGKLIFSTNDKNITKALILGYNDNDKLVYVRDTNLRSGVTSFDDNKGIKTLKIVGY